MTFSKNRPLLLNLIPNMPHAETSSFEDFKNNTQENPKDNMNYNIESKSMEKGFLSIIEDTIDVIVRMKNK